MNSKALHFGRTVCIAAVLFVSGVLMQVSEPARAQTSVKRNRIPIPTQRPDMRENRPSQLITETRPRMASMPGTRVTLAEAIFLGVRGNRSIKSAYTDRVVQKFGLRVVEDRFTPQLSLSGSIARQRIGNVESTEIGASPGVTALTKTGARFQFGWNNTASLSDGNNVSQSSLGLDIEQPLLRGAGLDVNMVPIRVAQLEEKVNQLRLAATVSQTVSSIILAHRALLLSQEEIVLAQAAVNRAESLLSTNRILIDSGRLPEIDAIQSEADLERQRLSVLSAERRRQQASLDLVNLMGLDLATTIVATETLSPVFQKLDVTRLIGVALQKRPDFLGQLLVLEQTRQGRIVAKNEQLWDISFFASARQDLILSESDASTDVRAGLRFDIPVRDLQRQSALIQADANIQSATIQLSEIRAGVEVQIRNSVSEINILWQQIAVASRSLDLAKRSVDAEILKLNEGRSSSLSVGILEDNLRSSEIQLLNARVDYMNSLTQLDLASGSTLETWMIGIRK